MREFKIGDEIKVKSWERLVDEFGNGDYRIGEFDCNDLYFVKQMKYLCGKVIKVTKDNIKGNFIAVKEPGYEEAWSLNTDMVYFLNDCEIETIKSDREQLLFAKLKPNATIPSKHYQDAGYDIYACFDEEQLTILPGETKMIPTGIASAFSSKYYAQLEERGSTGTKGMSQRCGVIDSKGMI